MIDAPMKEVAPFPSRALLEVENLSKDFPVRDVLGRSRGSVRAVSNVSFRIQRGETLGLVGESGCGKSTIGRAVLGLLEPTHGHVRFDGVDVARASRTELIALRRRMQIVFQDPHASLNPRLSVWAALAEPLEVHGVTRGAETSQRVTRLLDRVGLPDSVKKRFPHELSGGQCQRVSIARALSLGPELIVCDEATSALDMSVQAQILNLLLDLQRELQVAYLFITHNLAVVRHLADEVLVMYLGKVVEQASAAQLFAAPMHPYTRALLAANPSSDPKVSFQPEPLTGELPSPLDPPAGCAFHPRCRHAFELCRTRVPALRAPDPRPLAEAKNAGTQTDTAAVQTNVTGRTSRVACHLYDDAP
ncbi:MAG TPA: oligopeptide/dipeptide ABC transporter ATP-binding protein [Polyangiaceae bacterium]|nr:oligopeptide/dipeptide ABC transporter ATP-binding protein [Polyangiaceae bacterium]